MANILIGEGQVVDFTTQTLSYGKILYKFICLCAREDNGEVVPKDNEVFDLHTIVYITDAAWIPPERGTVVQYKCRAETHCTPSRSDKFPYMGFYNMRAWSFQLVHPYILPLPFDPIERIRQTSSNERLLSNA